MFSVTACPIPRAALLERYGQESSSDGHGYTDCFATEVRGSIPLPSFVLAFYTTWLFRLERVVLQYLVGKPSTDRDVRRLADGVAESFAAWYVEDRSADELLMCDFRGRTRSWFKVTAVDGRAATLLQFGSAIVPREDSRHASIGWGYRALFGLHRLYSRLLLGAARRRLERLRSDR